MNIGKNKVAIVWDKEKIPYSGSSFTSTRLRTGIREKNTHINVKTIDVFKVSSLDGAIQVVKKRSTRNMKKAVYRDYLGRIHSIKTN
jgi:hypothetical protein